MQDLYLFMSFYYLLDLKRCDSESSWTIHGLWPQYSPTHWPQWCNQSDHLSNQTLEHFPDLSTIWTSCEGPTQDYHFWAHEWSKHGTCSQMDQITYFNTTINLYHTFQDACWTRTPVTHPVFYQECQIPVIIPWDPRSEEHAITSPLVPP